MTSKLKHLSSELRRRHVYKVGTAYIVVGLGVLGAAELILEPLGLEAARPIIVVLTLLGLPIALVLAWAYEVRPEDPQPHELESPSETQGRVQDARASIAVLPFRNMSADPDQDYFCEGMAEEIINALTHLDDLKVIARTSAFAFKDTREDIREIGRKLGVAHLLEGSVRKAEDRLRITAQLIQAKDGSHVWSERYDRQVADVFDIQDDISLAIVDALKVKLLVGERAALTRRSTDNAVAYQLYLKAQPHFNRWLRDGIETAIDFLRQALLEDPSYGRAYATLSFCYTGLGFMGYVPPHEAYPKAKLAAQKALEIDDGMAEAHTALGMTSDHFDWDRVAAESHFRKAIDLSHVFAPGHIWYGWYLAQEARFEEGLAELRIARELDPLAVSFGLPTDFYIGEMLYFARRYDDAIEQLQKTLELEPDFPATLWFLGLAFHEKGNHEEAITYLERAFKASGRDPGVAPFLAYIYATAGKRDEAQKILDEILKRGEHGHLSAWDVALVHVGLGNVDGAFEWLERACEERAGWMVYLKTLPLLDPLRADSRFLTLLHRVGLEPNQVHGEGAEAWDQL